MAPVDNRSVSVMDSSLRRQLSVLRPIAAELGSNSVSVFLLRKGTRVQIIYRWPEPPDDRAVCPTSIKLPVAVDRLPERVGSEDPLGGLLQQFAPGARSFFLSSSGAQDVKAIVAFGLAGSGLSRPSAWDEVASTVSLVALATWSVHQVHWLATELAIVSERLGRRKLVERAKGILQVQHGWNEQQAYEHLRRLSRQRRVSMAAVAELMIRSPA